MLFDFWVLQIARERAPTGALSQSRQNEGVRITSKV